MAKRQAKPQSELPANRLLNQLMALALLEPGIAHRCFAQHLGALFGLAEAITLDTAHRRPRGTFARQPGVVEAANAQFLAHRRGLMEGIVQACTPGSSALRGSLPQPRARALADDDMAAFAPFLQFYLAQQRILASGAATLRQQVRGVLQTYSVGLAQLAALDAAFDETLAAYARKCFSVLPKLLRRRFEHWRQMADPVLDDETPPWLTPFGHEIQGLLLAELDARLEPALGLLEALNHEDSRTP
ncbi:MAG: DUF3348 domain-containing protein [Gammaproteobacteria bacterium]|nr:DUF3348 domain-containing protein [Gammaproteobacteria bacterium]